MNRRRFFSLVVAAPLMPFASAVSSKEMERQIVELISRIASQNIAESVFGRGGLALVGEFGPELIEWQRR